MVDERDSHVAALGQHAKRLVDLYPQMPRRLLVRQETTETTEQWERVLRTAAQLVERCQHGLLPVVALIGPSGAGKSTIFCLLTGIEVPAGSAKRPCTYNMLAAVPRGTPREDLQRMFRHFDLQPLNCPDQLKHPGEPSDRLYFKDDWTCQGRVPYCLVDVPDFCTYARANWEKAERMVERADVVLFVTTAEQYADEKSVQWLRTSACRAGFLIILLTKVESEQAAQEIYEDFDCVVEGCVRSGTAENGPGLDDCRSDGMTTRQFLKQSWFYYSERSRTPRLEDLRGLCGDVPPLGEFFQGHFVQQIVFDKMTRDVKSLVARGRRIEREIRQRSQELARWHREIEQEVRKTKFLVQRIGLQELHLIPQGRLLEIAIEVAERQSPWIGSLRKKVRSAAGQGRAWMVRQMERYPISGEVLRHVSKLQRYLPARRVDDDAQDDWETQERERVLKNAEELIRRLSERWEERWSAETNQDDLAPRLEERLKKLSEGDWLPAHIHWEPWVADQYEQWFQQNPGHREWFLAQRSIHKGLAIGCFAADIVFTSGGLSLLVTGPLAALHLTPDFQSLLAGRLASEWLQIREAQLAEWVFQQVVRPVMLEGLPAPLNETETHTLNEWDHLLKKMQDHLSAVLLSTGQTGT